MLHAPAVEILGYMLQQREEEKREAEADNMRRKEHWYVTYQSVKLSQKPSDNATKKSIKELDKARESHEQNIHPHPERLNKKNNYALDSQSSDKNNEWDWEQLEQLAAAQNNE